ncbi:MAG TPA: carboxypeptidase-like regulatory domain-containing protein [Bryobacteraceae bacterium]|nr:carboxypeptidase-like regulatory domain-containing protein [Bryobacteraceae bacterium]
MASFLQAQVVGGSISGSVRDQAGAPLPGVKVRLINNENGSERTLETDSAGRFVVPSVAVGSYNVEASKTGFQTQIKAGVNLVVGQAAQVELVLPVGEVHEVVTVEDQPEAVSVTTQQTSGLVNEKQVKELPLNGRSFDNLMTLNPATVNYTSQRSGGIGTSNSAVGNMFAVSGHRPQENLFLLNGIEYTGASEINNTPGGTSGQLLGVDAVREFNVVTDTYGAEYGKRPGAQVSIVTASGSNQLHGSLYEFLRNSDLDARNFFDQKIPQFQRNEFGGALGGPIKRNKLFLFGNYEGFRQHLGLSDVTFVPDNATRNSAKISPAAKELLALWPVQNGPSLGGGIGLAYSNPLQTIREDFGTTRLDYNISDRDTFFGVYTIDDSGANTPSQNPLSGVFETLREQVASVQEQHVFSPSVLNTARFGFSRAGYFFTGTTPVDVPGWVAGDPIGAVVIGGGTALNGASQISLGGTNAGSNLSAVRNLFTYDDHIAINKGIHQIEAGVWLQRIQANDNLAQYQYGQASFSSLAAFLKGTVSTFTVIPSPTPLGWRSLEGAVFVQDAIRPVRGLELRVGFRFESTNGWNEAHGRGANYTFPNGVIATDPRIASSAFTVNRAKFLPEPRFGFAWDPFGKSKTVINGGFGIYRFLLDNLDYRLDQTAPFNATQTLKNVPLSALQIVPGQALPASGKISPSGIQPDAYTPTILSWTFKVQQEIAPNTALSVGYAGSHGYHEILSLDANEPFPSFTANGSVYYPQNAVLANPKLANTTSWFSEGVSSFNALEIDLTRRFTNGLQLRGAYTFSKSLDDGTAWNSSVASNAPGFVMFPLNPKWDYGLSTTDVRHLATINGTYELPLGRGKKFLGGVEGWRDKLASGWSISAIESVQSGLPFTPQLGYNPTNNGDSRNPIRPSWNPAFTGNLMLGSPNLYFDPNAFVSPASGTYGNVGRDTLIGPGIVSLDASLLKNTSITERVRLQFRAEFFNALNHVNFSTPNPVVFTAANSAPSPTAGVITATSTTSRQVQFGLKLLF